MIADAYRAAIGEGASSELKLANLINRFGVYGALGRPLTMKEANRIMIAEDVIKAIRLLKEMSFNEFADKYPYFAKLYVKAKELTDG